MPRIISCKFLSTQRFGNAAFIYCFLKGYAQHMNCELQLPEKWVGRKVLANANEPVISSNLPQTTLDSECKQPVGYWFGAAGVDVKAYCQNQKYLDFYTRSQAREWLRFKPEYERYAVNYGTYSVAHLRRGDYVSDPLLRKLYCEVSEASYDRAIEKFGIPKPVFKVSEGWRMPPAELQKEGLGWLPDFLFLRDATYLLRANSSFSVWSSWLGNAKTYSPIVGDKVGLNECEFVDGNHENTAGRFPNQSSLYLKE